MRKRHAHRRACENGPLAGHVLASVRPGLHAVEAEIVRIGQLLAGGFLRRDHAIFDAFTLRIGFGCFLRFEIQANLLLRIRAGRIAEHRIDAARTGLVEFQNPAVGLGLARLHGGFSRTIDLGRHALTLLPLQRANP